MNILSTLGWDSSVAHRTQSLALSQGLMNSKGLFDLKILVSEFLAQQQDKNRVIREIRAKGMKTLRTFFFKRPILSLKRTF